MGRYEKTFWEFGTDAKASKTSVHTPDLTAGNFAAQIALRDAFEAAIDAVSLGNSGRESTIAVETDPGRVPSLNPIAQRENKWLVSFNDNTLGNPGSFTVPCYDPALLGADGENMDAGAAEYAALVTATEAYIRSVAGNVVTVTSVKFSARTI